MLLLEYCKKYYTGETKSVTSNASWDTVKLHTDKINKDLLKQIQLNNPYANFTETSISYDKELEVYTLKCPYCQRVFTKEKEDILGLELNCGCNRGYRSLPELIIANTLRKLDLPFIYEVDYSDNDIEELKGHKGDFVIAIPVKDKYKWFIGIQFDGKHHFEKTYKGVKTSNVRYIDKLHDRYMESHNILDIRIRYDEVPYNKLPDLIEYKLKKLLNTDTLQTFREYLQTMQELQKKVTLEEKEVIDYISLTSNYITDLGDNHITFNRINLQKSIVTYQIILDPYRTTQQIQKVRSDFIKITLPTKISIKKLSLLLKTV